MAAADRLTKEEKEREENVCVPKGSASCLSAFSLASQQPAQAVPIALTSFSDETVASLRRTQAETHTQAQQTSCRGRSVGVAPSAVMGVWRLIQLGPRNRALIAGPRNGLVPHLCPSLFLCVCLRISHWFDTRLSWYPINSTAERTALSH